MPNRIKILGIAPYASMKTLMTRVAMQFPEIDLTVYVGDLEKGAEIVKNNTEIYDVIISRGGTAQLIQEFSSIPVMDISLSVYDILRAVKLADNNRQRYAIVGFPRITDSASTLCSLLQHHVPIITIHSSEEAMSISEKLYQEGYQLLLGDNVATYCAKTLGMNSILITSGIESITSTFERAISFFRNIAGIRTELAVIRSSFWGQSSSTLILNEQGDSVFSCFQSEDLNTAAAITSSLKNKLAECLQTEKKKIFINVNQKMFSTSSYSFDNTGKRYVSFHIWGNDVPIVSNHKGVKITNSPQLTEINSLFESISSNQILISQVRKMELYTTPVIILGEKGTGKSHLAAMIHCNSPLKNNPFIEINCRLITAKTWNYLISSYNSPFLDSNNTLYFRDINYLSPEQTKHLTSLILDSNLCGRNRVIFSYNTESDASASVDFHDFVNSFTSVTFQILPLRENPAEIAKIANLYLNDLNIELGKGLVGFEPEALDLLQNYLWPHNITQFKRVLHEIAMVSDDPFVTSEVVYSFLSREPHNSPVLRNSSPQKGKEKRNARNQTLAQMNKEILLATLEENMGNQTKTAKQLGISRSTLWRYLKA